MAEGRLSFERAGAATVLRAAYAESPLRLLTPRNHGRSAWAYLSTLGGGFVDGDRVRLSDGTEVRASNTGSSSLASAAIGLAAVSLALLAAGRVLRRGA